MSSDGRQASAVLKWHLVCRGRQGGAGVSSSRSEKLMLRRQLRIRPKISLLLPLVLVVVLAIPGAASPVPSRTDQTVDPRALFEQAQRALNAGDYAQAEQGFLAVLRIDPQSAGAYFNLGVVYLRTEKFDAAIASLEKARRLA